MKKCTKCKKEKSLDDFYKSIQTKDGYDYMCKQCRTDYTKQYRSKINANRRKKLATNFEYRISHNKKKMEKYWEEREKHIYYSTRSTAKIKNIPFNIEKEDIIIPEYCPLLNVKLDKGRYSPSIDKIIPELGYIKGNVRIISKKANTMKNDGSINELLEFAKNIKTYLNIEEIVQPIENKNL